MLSEVSYRHMQKAGAEIYARDKLLSVHVDGESQGTEEGQRQRYASTVPAAISTLVLRHVVTQCSSSQTTDV